MGVLSDWFKKFNPMNLLGDLGSSAIGALGAWFGQQSQYKYNKRLQDDAQDFNSAEAAKNRDWQTFMNRENNQFNAAQAELARQFQEDFYNKYQSPSAMMSQYKDAGINPVLAAGQATNTPPSASSASAGSAPSGASASSGINGVGPMDLIGSIASIMKLKAEINNINADTEGKKAAADLNRSSVMLNEQNIAESRSRVSKLIAETKSEELKQGLIAAQQLLAETQSSLNKQQTTNLTFDQFEKEMRQKFMKDFKTLPSSNLFESVWNLIFMGKNWIQDLIK